MSAFSKRLLLVSAMVLATALAAACGGDDNAKDVSSGSPAATTPAGEGGGATATTSSGSNIPTAGPELSAFHLLDANGYAAALGEQVTAIEDDGTFPDSSGCEVSQARVLTATSGTVLTLTLWSEQSADSAQSIYQQYAYFGDTPTPIAGVDQGAYEAGTAILQKGPQVLQVKARASAAEQARLDQIKGSGGDPSAQYLAIVAVANTVAPALARALTGASCTGPAISPPAGGYDPCLMDPSAIDADLGVSGTTAQPVISDTLPYEECVYSSPGLEPFLAYSATDTLLENGVDETTVKDLFSQAKSSHATSAVGKYETFDEPPFHAFGNTRYGAIGVDNWFYFDASEAASDARPSGGDVHPVLQVTEPLTSVFLRWLESASGVTVVSLDECKKLMTDWVHDALGNLRSSMPVAEAAQAYNDAVQAMIDYCDKATTSVDLNR